MNDDEEEQIAFSLVLNRTAQDIQQEIGDMVLAYPRIQNPVEICEKLLGQYVVVQELYQLIRGRYVRWIVPEKGTLSSGGIVLDIQFKQGNKSNDKSNDMEEDQESAKKTGVFVLCRTYSGGLFHFQYDNTLVFQKMKPREVLYLDLLAADKN